MKVDSSTRKPTERIYETNNKHRRHIQSTRKPTEQIKHTKKNVFAQLLAMSETGVIKT